MQEAQSNAARRIAADVRAGYPDARVRVDTTRPKGPTVRVRHPDRSYLERVASDCQAFSLTWGRDRRGSAVLIIQP